MRRLELLFWWLALRQLERHWLENYFVLGDTHWWLFACCVVVRCHARRHSLYKQVIVNSVLLYWTPVKPLNVLGLSRLTEVIQCFASNYRAF